MGHGIALGDTFSSFKVIEKGIFQGEFLSIIKQGIHVVTALLGANAAYGYIRLIQRFGALWGIRTKKPAIIIGFYTGVITGVLIGLAVMTTIVSYRLENFHRMNAYLESVITEKNAQLEQLEKSVNKGKYIVKSIDVVFLCDYEGVDILLFETELKRNIMRCSARRSKPLTLK